MIMACTNSTEFKKIINGYRKLMVLGEILEAQSIKSNIMSPSKNI